MICALCEHVQEQGDSCEQCGKRFAPESAVEVDVEPCADLQPTRVESAREAPVFPLAGFERGREVTELEARPPPASTYLLDEEDKLRCTNCGLLGRSGQRCAACGVPSVAISS